MVIAILTHDKNGGYDKNKVAIKTLFKSYGLIFNRGKYMQGKYSWEKGEEVVEATFVKNDVGDTLVAKFMITVSPQFEQVLKSTFTLLGGQWNVQEEQIPTPPDEDKIWMHKFINEERKARSNRWEHCPILKPMIKEYLNFKGIPITEQEIERILKIVYAEVDEIMRNRNIWQIKK